MNRYLSFRMKRSVEATSRRKNAEPFRWELAGGVFGRPKAATAPRTAIPTQNHCATGYNRPVR